MAKYILNTSSALLLLSALLSVSSCSSDIDVAVAPESTKNVEVALKGLPSRSGEAPSAAASLSVFQFAGSHLIKSTKVEAYDSEKISLDKGNTTDIYFASGVDVEVSSDMTLSEFLNSTVTSAEGAQSAPLFFTAVSSVSDSADGLEVAMKRGVARIDLDANGTELNINEIIIEDAPAASYVFEGDKGMYMPEKTTYSYAFQSAPEGVVKNMFMLFESDDAVNVSIHATQNGKQVSYKAVLDSIERNKVYTLRVYDTDVSIGASFAVAEWEDGGNVDGGLNGGLPLLIDKDNSWFPAGVTVDYTQNIIDIPGDGAKGIKLAFLSELRVDIASVDFVGERVLADSVADTQVKIVAETPVNSLAGVLTCLNVDVAPQLKGRPGYEFKMSVKKCSMVASYDYVTVRVAPSPIQIETVRIAGYDWMAFNCTTPDIDDQIYVEEGLTVEDMYVKDWVRCVGGIFQYGRRYSYIPYQGYNPCNNLGEQAQDMPWVHDTHMPCPKGYHVPSLDEMRSLFPHGVTIPSTYTAGNGESITVELVRLPGDVVTPTNVNGVCRYLKFISNETGNCLILPLAGWKGDKSTAASANFGRDGVYWSNNSENCAGGHAKAWRFMFNWGDTCEMQEFQFAMEAFAYVRAIKNY